MDSVLNCLTHPETRQPSPSGQVAASSCLSKCSLPAAELSRPLNSRAGGVILSVAASDPRPSFRRLFGRGAFLRNFRWGSLFFALRRGLAFFHFFLGHLFDRFYSGRGDLGYDLLDVCK